MELPLQPTSCVPRIWRATRQNAAGGIEFRSRPPSEYVPSWGSLDENCPASRGERMKRGLTSAELASVAERLKVLAEPARLELLQALMPGERSVGQLVQMTGLTQANVSKHLHLLLARHLVAQRDDGLFVYYHIADESVYQFCELVCNRLERETREWLPASSTGLSGRPVRPAIAR